MAKQSAGILLFRHRQGDLEVFLVHPGGPFFARKDFGSWSIPKGEIADGEDPLSSAIREFNEETGTPVQGAFIALDPIRQKGGKVVHAWALEGDMDADKIVSNTFMLNGRAFPEVDRAAWFATGEAKRRINEAQKDLITALEKLQR